MMCCHDQLLPNIVLVTSQCIMYWIMCCQDRLLPDIAVGGSGHGEPHSLPCDASRRTPDGSSAEFHLQNVPLVLQLDGKRARGVDVHLRCLLCFLTKVGSFQ